MNTLKVTVPDSLCGFLENQVKAGGYGSAENYIQELLRREAQKRESWDKLEGLILQGLSSGDPIERTEADWEGKRRRLEEQHGSRDIEKILEE